MIRIAIDGPGGAGKSSVAKAVAKKLGIIYVDTGALYRNIGYYALKSGVNPEDSKSVIALLSDITLELKFENGKQIILLCGEDVGDAIRAPEVSMAASAVSAIPEIRAFLLDMQRKTANENSLIMDGRDIGTVIIPDAEVKIFLTASAEARAKRRYDELIAKGLEASYDDVYREMIERDKNDSTRDIAPCVQAKDAILLDNSSLSADETVEAVLDIIKKFEDGKKVKKKKDGYMRLYSLLAPLFRFFMRLKPHGLENLPKEGGVIICANHISAMDVFCIAAVYPRHVKFIAKKELFSIPVIGWLIKALGAIKLDRGGNDISAIRKAITEAENGFPVAIFPQGHRYPGVNPASTPTKNGAAMIAYHSHSPVVPVAINTKGARFGLFRRIDVCFGEIIPNEMLGFENGGRDEYENATRIVFDEILKLTRYSDLPEYIPETKKSKARKRR